MIIKQILLNLKTYYIQETSYNSDVCFIAIQTNYFVQREPENVLIGSKFAPTDWSKLI